MSCNCKQEWCPICTGTESPGRKPKALEWVSVSEQLPDDHDDVMWQPEKEPDEPYELPLIGYLNEWRDKVILQGCRVGRKPSDFSHWMPLPEPPTRD
jgi:hypothetical protein